jgi:hypothetical protein
LTLIAFEIFPQRKVSGVISEIDGEAMVGTLIQEVDTDNRTVSNIDGSFHITTINDECTLNFSFVGYVSNTVRITQDTIVNIVLKEDCTGCCDCRGLITFGTNYEIVNSLIGLVFSNGYDEMPLIHFEEFPDRVIYKMNVQTNFDKDYSFGANVGLRYPFVPHIRLFSMISAGYSQYDYPSKDFFHRDIHASVRTYLRNTELTLKTGYQKLNDYHNWGALVGLQKMIIYRRLLVGLSTGYYFDYLTFSTYFQGIIHKNISFRLGYDRMDKYNFCNFGLNFIWNRKP